MLSARKRKKTTSSYYVIGLDPDDLSRDSKGCFGKLKANFVGTGFSFFAGGAAKVDGGCAPAVAVLLNIAWARALRKQATWSWLASHRSTQHKCAALPEHSGGRAALAAAVGT